MMDTLTDHVPLVIDPGDFWPERHYWRDRIRAVAPHATPRDIVTGARVLHGLYAHAATVDTLPEDLDAVVAEVTNVRRRMSSADAEARRAVMVIGNIADDYRRPLPASVDAYDGVRHQMHKRRSNSGRTVTQVTRSGVAPVIGRADNVRTLRRCAIPAGPYRYRTLRRFPLGVSRQRRRSVAVDAVRTVAAPVTARLSGMNAVLGLHLLEHAPRRTIGHGARGKRSTFTVRRTVRRSGMVTPQRYAALRRAPLGVSPERRQYVALDRTVTTIVTGARVPVERRPDAANAIAVEQVTARLFGLPAVSDLRQWCEVTPELDGAEVIPGVAVHRADMAGQTGVLALTQRIDDYPLARWPDYDPRYAKRNGDLRVLPLRASERHWTDNGQLRFLTLTWCTYVLPAPHHDPARLFIGHGARDRGPLARGGKRKARTEQSIPLSTRAATSHTPPTTAAEWVTLCAALDIGKRYAATTASGATVTVTRSGAARWQGTARLADGTRVRVQRRTSDGMGRALFGALSV
jgi:hypothetical protein